MQEVGRSKFEVVAKTVVVVSHLILTWIGVLTPILMVILDRTLFWFCGE